MKIQFLFSIFVFLSFIGCQDEGSPVSPNPNNGGSSNISYSSTILPILNANCVSCHGSSGGWSVSALTTAVNNRTLMSLRGASGDRLITPNDPAQSEIYDRITDDNPSRRMPPSGSLTTEQINLIRNWITQGANP
ncbi:MAG: hypothetical protein N2450_05510 [bacterium]|nr:hypothetical protein [bacterium]